MQVRKQQLELDMEQQTGSKQEKECVKALYCHPAYLNYMQSTGVQPRWIQGIRSGDSVGEETYLFINIRLD